MQSRTLVLLVVACALFMENLDSTVLSTALPAIAADFNEDPIRLKLALTSYLISLAVFIPASGWLADTFGARLVFRLAIVVFTLGSIACGLSGSIPEIVVARVVQGMGGAMMVPVGRLVIMRTIPKSELISAMAWLTVPALTGPVLGPPLGGFITTYFEWRWIFWVNVPIGIVGLIFATLVIPDVRGETRRPFDALGFLLSGMGLALVVSGGTNLGLDVLPRTWIFAMLGVGGVLLTIYYFHARRTTSPILDLTLFAIPTYRIAILGGALFRIGVGATPFLIPLMLQLVYGLTPFASGMTTFVAAIGAIAMKFVAPPVLRRLGFRTILIINGALCAVFIALPAAFSLSTPVIMFSAVLLVGGFFRSLQFTSTNSLAIADIEPGRMSSATSMSSVVQQLAISIGISLAAITLELTRVARGGEALAISDFSAAFVVIGLATLASVLLFLTLPGDAGREVSGHKRELAPDAVTAARER
ncbi:DHA2 family efflux MFS transporter permease subunit [Microbaculum marinum]|uniref:DHA2 family efflux MFS transporter permease subunit n=1 Tax=Microbaculum marinum TaxID=1764581 RepID=A0AAW9RGM0_9HYPH